MHVIKKLLSHAFPICCLSISIFLLLFILKQFYLFDFLLRFLYALKPLWIGAILAFFIQPLIKKETVFHTLLVYISFILFFVMIFILFTYLIICNFSSIMNVFQNSSKFILNIFEKYELLEFIDMKQLSLFLVNGYEWLVPLIQNISQFMMSFILSVTIAFFISLEYSLLVNEFKKYVKNYSTYLDIYDIFSNILRQYVRSTFLDMVYIIISTSLILFMFKTPMPILLACLLAFMNLFPYIGALLGSLFLILIHLMFVQEHLLLLVIVLFINSQVESNIIHTWICHKTMKVHPLYLFVALLINEFLFGMMGVILSPIFASAFQIAVNTYREFLNQKNIGGWEELDK